MPHCIILHKLELKDVRVEIPIADITHGIPGPTVLITGGIDGDEYTGIRAAYDLIDFYSQHSVPGRIVILPVVNTTGFYAGLSRNPIDNKYPKYIFPGNKNGTATEHLLAWLNTNFLTDTTMWIDLHSGALTERLTPFIWGFETRKKNANRLTMSVLRSLYAKRMVYEKAPFLSKADRLAARGCAYLIFEAGQQGSQNEKDIEQMVSWVKKTVAVVHGESQKEQKIKVFQKVTMYRAKFDGMWFPAVELKEVAKGARGGTLRTLDSKKQEKVEIKDSGTVLWMKSSLFAKRNDDLIAVASSPQLA